MEFSTEYYPSHRKGKKTRSEILAAVMEFPEITLEIIALKTGKSQRHTRRQIQQLLADGKIHKSGIGYSVGRKVISFF